MPKTGATVPRAGGRLWTATSPEARGKRAAVRVVETRCLGICPRHAVAVVDGQRIDAIPILARGTQVSTITDRLELLPA